MLPTSTIFITDAAAKSFSAKTFETYSKMLVDFEGIDSFLKSVDTVVGLAYQFNHIKVSHKLTGMIHHPLIDLLTVVCFQ